MKYAPAARIALRYLSGLLVGWGVLAPGTALAANPDMVAVAAGLIGAGVEAFYAMAKRKGWDT